MKRKIILFSIILLIFIIPVLCFSQSNNYAGRNGTILDVKNNGNSKLVIRKHIQSFQLGNLAKEYNLILYDNPSMGAVRIGRINIGDYININKVAEEISVEDNISVWLFINDAGWILFGNFNNLYTKYSVPYYEDRWSIIESIDLNNRKWTVRKMVSQYVAVEEVLNIRDKPGLAGTKVISKIVPPKEGNPVVNQEVSAVTEEVEKIDNKTDRWLKIVYQGVEGWIFGGYTHVERGGPKYWIPEYIIENKLIDGP